MALTRWRRPPLYLRLWTMVGVLVGFFGISFFLLARLLNGTAWILYH
jgi:hypothetical protein